MALVKQNWQKVWLQGVTQGEVGAERQMEHSLKADMIVGRNYGRKL